MSENVLDITVQRDDLVRELAVAEQAASRKPTIPVLSNVLLEAAAGRLTLAATDLEVWLVTHCACESTVAGSATVSAAKLLEMARSLPSGTAIRLQSTDGKGGVRLDGGGFTARLQALPVRDFPMRPEMPTSWTELPRAAMRGMVLRTRYATKDDQRYFMNGVLLCVGDVVRMVSTDGHRMAVATAKRVEGAAMPDGILPKRTLEALVAALEDDSDVVQYAQLENHLCFQLGERQLVSRVVDGKFPAWERIMQVPSGVFATVPRELLLGALRRTAMVSDREASGVTLSLSAGSLALSASSVTIGDANEAVPVTYTGPEVQSKLNIGYAIDFVAAAETEFVELEIRDAGKPVMFREKTETQECTGIIMPMR